MTLVVAFLAGLISCLSPCVLPVIPVFVGYVGGGGALVATGVASLVAAPGRGRLRAAGFLLGFAGVFVVIFVSLGLVGFALLSTVPVLRVVAGLAIVGLGVATAIGWQPRITVGTYGAGSTFAGSLLLGGGIAVGWTPCIGPTLGAILTMAAASESVLAGGLLLLAYAAGMVVPFLAVAFGLSRFRPLSRYVSRHQRALRVATGVLIAVVGILVATNAFSRLAGLIPWRF
jgi:cytochrome c-type biogenesis protein